MTPKDEIKQKIDIVSLISEYTPLKKMGRNFKARCPFHNEKSPSFVVSPERQIWHCFGCGAGGDQFEFIEKIENVDFVEALQILAKKAGVKLTEFKYDSQTSQKKDRLYQINHLASEYYHYLLVNHDSGEKALDYILKRGITKKSLELFKIGYAPNSWEGVSRFLLKKGFTEVELEEAGLVIRDKSGRSFYDRFRGRLMFTLKDHRGNVVGFAGRKLPTDNPEDEKEAKYVNSPETPVYIKGNVLYGMDLTRDSIRSKNQAIVVEGEIDAISSYQAGLDNIVAIKGSALTEGQLHLLKRYCDTLLLSLDADLAGDLAARRGIELAENIGFTIKVVRLIFGKDPNECIEKDPKFWRESVKNAVPIYDFYIDSSITKFNPEEAEGKKRICDEILPLLLKIENLVVREHYLKILAIKIKTTVDVLTLQMGKIRKEEKLPRFTTNKEKDHEEDAVKKDRREQLEEYLLALVLQSLKPGNWQDKLTQAVNYYKDSALKKILLRINEYIDHGIKWEIKTFVEKLPEELVPTVDRLFLYDTQVTADNLEEEFINTFGKIKYLYLKNELLLIGEKISNTDDGEELRKLNAKFEETTREIKVINN